MDLDEVNDLSENAGIRQMPTIALLNRVAATLLDSEKVEAVFLQNKRVDNFPIVHRNCSPTFRMTCFDGKSVLERKRFEHLAFFEADIQIFRLMPAVIESIDRCFVQSVSMIDRKTRISVRCHQSFYESSEIGNRSNGGWYS